MSKSLRELYFEARPFYTDGVPRSNDKTNKILLKQYYSQKEIQAILDKFNPIHVPDEFIDEGRKQTPRNNKIFWIRSDYIEHVFREETR